MSGSVFTENIASARGGGMYAGGSQVIDVTDCQFARNRAEEGGGIYTGGSIGEPFEVVASVFTANVATVRNGGGI